MIRINKRSCSVVLDLDDGDLGHLGCVADLLLEAILPQEETHRLNPGINMPLKSELRSPENERAEREK